MARYLLDTTVLIDISRGAEAVVEGVQSLRRVGDEVGVCAVVIAEFFSGVRLPERPRWRRYVRGLRYWETTPEAALLAGFYRYGFARQGRPVQTTDALIAAVAVSVGAIVVTASVKDYPMVDLRVLALRA